MIEIQYAFSNKKGKTNGNTMNIAEQISLKLQLKENSEVEYKSAAGGFPKTEFWRSFSALANTNEEQLCWE